MKMLKLLLLCTLSFTCVSFTSTPVQLQIKKQTGRTFFFAPSMKGISISSRLDWEEYTVVHENVTYRKSVDALCLDPTKRCIYTLGRPDQIKDIPDSNITREIFDCIQTEYRAIKYSYKKSQEPLVPIPENKLLLFISRKKVKLKSKAYL